MHDKVELFRKETPTREQRLRRIAMLESARRNVQEELDRIDLFIRRDREALGHPE